MDSIPYHVQGNTIEFLQVSSGIAPLYPCRISTGISEGEGIAELINPDEPMATGRCNAWLGILSITWPWWGKKNMVTMVTNTMTLSAWVHSWLMRIGTGAAWSGNLQEMHRGYLIQRQGVKQVECPLKPKTSQNPGNSQIPRRKVE